MQARLLCVTLLLTGILQGAVAPPPQWIHGPPTNPAYFPIAVWLQDPKNAPRYRAAGINLYVGLWRGPTSNQLEDLRRAGMSVICAQTPDSLRFQNDPVIVGWMHEDEPDNAQSLGEGKGYGPPVAPDVIIRDYQRMRAADPTRPVLLNLGQGVAWDAWIGRGVRRNRPEDYPEYLRGCDIASFDIYPVVHEHPEVSGKLEFVARGVERLRQWTDGRKPVWNCIEAARIGNPNQKPTPDQVRAEVWMSILRGSRGLIYFVHQFQPTFREAALLDDPELLAAVSTLNRQIQTLAPLIHSPDIVDGVFVESTGGAAVAWMFKRQGNLACLFVANLTGSATQIGVTFRESTLLLHSGSSAEVLGESRQVRMRNQAFTDGFQPYGVHLYEFHPGRSP